MRPSDGGMARSSQTQLNISQVQPANAHMLSYLTLLSDDVDICDVAARMSISPRLNPRTVSQADGTASSYARINDETAARAHATDYC